MSQVNDVWSWGQESSETNEDNSGSTDPVDWDDNSWGNSWDNNEIIQNDQQLVEAFKKEKCQASNSKNHSTLHTHATNHNQHGLYENNISSFNQNHQYYQQQGEVIENQNYNSQGYPTQYKDQYPYDNQQHQFVDHNNGCYNYIQATSPSDTPKAIDYHDGQTYNTELSSCAQHVDQTYSLYNAVITNNGVHGNHNLSEIHYNQNAWYNPTEQVQHCQENQSMHHQVASNLSDEINSSPNVPVTTNSKNYDPVGIDSINCSLNTGSSEVENYYHKNNELTVFNHADTGQSTPNISLGGGNKNSWYQDEYENIPLANRICEQNLNSYDITKVENISYHENNMTSSNTCLGTDNNTLENEENIHVELTNKVEAESFCPISTTNIKETNKLEDIFNTIVQQEQMNEETNTLHIKTNLEESFDSQNIENKVCDNNNVPVEVIQEEIASDNIANESEMLTIVKKETIKHNIGVLPKETVIQSIPVDRTETATPYDNLCEDISNVHIEYQVRSLPNGNNVEPNDNTNNSTNEEKCINLTNIIKGGPQKYVHLNLKNKESVEENVGNTSAALLNQNQVAAEKLSRLKRSTEKTTKDRNQYLETGELQDSPPLSEHETEDDNDEAPTFVRMIPGSEMSDPNVTQPNTRQSNTSDSGNKANSSLPSTSRKQIKSKRHPPRSPSPQDTDSNSNNEEEEEEDKVEDQKLMKIIKTIMSEEKAKKTTRSRKKNGKENLETTALRIAKILKAQKQAAIPQADSSEEEGRKSSFDRKPPLPNSNNNSKPSSRLTDFEKYINSLPRRKLHCGRSTKPSLTSSPTPLEDQMAAMSLQDRDKYSERLQRPFPQRTPPSRPFPTTPGQSYPDRQGYPEREGYPERPYPQRTPPSTVYPHRTPTQTYSERSMKSPFTDISSLDRRQLRKSAGDSFASHAQFLAGVLANFPTITAEQSDRMKRLSLTYPLEYKAWYMESYLTTLRKYKERMAEKTVAMRNRINKQFGKHCIGKVRLGSLMKFEGRNVHKYNIDVQRVFHCYEDIDYLHEIELLTPFTFDNEDKKCFYGFVQSMIHKANSLSEQLLYQLIELTFKSKGEIELSDIGDLLIRSYSKVKGSQFLKYPDTELWTPRNTEEEKFKLRQHVVNNQKQKAFQLALHTKDWALATILSNLPNSNVSRSEVHAAFLSNLPANDPLRSCFQLMSDQNLELKSNNAPVDLTEWGIHLAAILNNSTPDTLDTAAILKLGHSLGKKGDNFGEQFCTLTVNAPWIRFQLLGATCGDSDIDNVATGRNLLLSMAYENAAKLRPDCSAGYQFVQLQYMKYHFALKLLRMGKKQMCLHFLHHASEEVLGHLEQFLPAHISLLENVVDLTSVCADGQAKKMTWYTQLLQVLSQHVPARCVTLPPVQPDASLSIEHTITQPEYSQPPSSLSNYGGYGEHQDLMRQTPVSLAMSERRFNPVSNAMDTSDMTGPQSLGNELSRPMASEYGPKSLGAIVNDYGSKPTGNVARNLPSADGPQRASAFNKPRPNAVRSNAMIAGSNVNRSEPLGNNPMANSTPMTIRSTPMLPQQNEAKFKPTSQFFTPALVPTEQSTYMQHLQDSELSTSMNQISLNSGFSYATHDSQNNENKSDNSRQLGTSSVATGTPGGASGGGWFGFLKKNSPAVGKNSTQENQESSHPSGNPVNSNNMGAPPPQQPQYPAPSYSAPLQPYLPNLSHDSNPQSGFYQPQQQSYSRSSSPASSLSTEVRYYTSRRPSWSHQHRYAPH